ncbi:MAG: hypothetical protein IPM79_18950 [Polyangiaceae bacterium]|jgi:hypothetical protein|nr:hypothetical protein [Polyangiaceae bacterium]MBK8939635.1 hypothetical protein [Polyangiaceae bacterium]
MRSEIDDEDRAAVMARRELLLRRSLLVGAVGAIASSASCDACHPSVCLSAPVEPYCEKTGDAPLPAGSTRWRRTREGAIETDVGPLFEGDKPADPAKAGTDGRFTSEGVPPGINALSEAGRAAFAELAPGHVGASVQISVYIEPEFQGPGVDGRARAESIRAFLASKGVQAKVTGSGSSARGSFRMHVFFYACIAPAQSDGGP